MTGSVPARAEPFVRRVRVRNYRSIASCDVELGPLTVLLGPNASGKSNFVDALRFAKEVMYGSPTDAVARRGGLDPLLHRSASGSAESFRIELDLTIPPHRDGEVPLPATYGFEIAADPRDELPLLVTQETARIGRPDAEAALPLPAGPTSRLQLPVSSADEGSPLLRLQTSLWMMLFYDLDSAALRAVNEEGDRRIIREFGQSGERLGRVLAAMEHRDPAGKERLDAYLSALVPGALGVDERREGRYSTVQARFRSNDGVQTFLRESLSEGTLRAAGVLAALLQVPVSAGVATLVAIEEPETALHPATVGALYEALDDASMRTQVIVTSQSSDLLDSEYAHLDHIRAVANVGGATRIGRVDASGYNIVDKGLMTISELHRSGQMLPAVVGFPVEDRPEEDR
ncbi:AAA family ATPase [Polymorphospora rubra]|uniref:Chromosome segregation protein SMC n=1 Tax=Polymorphospora rubra TaxID=338584 RepID=A0A810NCI9_9ACTN|nr:AAA family ATPase [Polymorphospora rubra]BCJ70054.1 chromosome segregation protein SMC [Polymorphospora rubra]